MVKYLTAKQGSQIQVKIDFFLELFGIHRHLVCFPFVFSLTSTLCIFLLFWYRRLSACKFFFFKLWEITLFSRKMISLNHIFSYSIQSVCLLCDFTSFVIPRRRCKCTSLFRFSSHIEGST